MEDVMKFALPLASVLVVLSLTTAIHAQAPAGKSTESAQSATATSSRSGPVFTEYKGIKIGLPASDVRTSLEKFLKAKGDAQDVLVVSENELAQVFYDENGRVRAVSIDYAKNGSAPTPAQVLGKEVAPRADGSVYAMERYPELGYWVSYYRTSGENSIVTITMQALK
jgi:hypothetical protein